MIRPSRSTSCFQQFHVLVVDVDRTRNVARGAETALQLLLQALPLLSAFCGHRASAFRTEASTHLKLANFVLAERGSMQDSPAGCNSIRPPFLLPRRESSSLDTGADRRRFPMKTPAAPFFRCFGVRFLSKRRRITSGQRSFFSVITGHCAPFRRSVPCRASTLPEGCLHGKWRPPGIPERMPRSRCIHPDGCKGSLRLRRNTPPGKRRRNR